jgi:hypothetical protein
MSPRKAGGGLGRRPAPDSRDRNFLLRRRLAAAEEIVLPSKKTWAIGAKSINQFKTGTCVGHGWRNFLRCAPIRTESKNAPSPWEIYRAAILEDEWTENDGETIYPDGAEELEFGTSVRAGAKAVTAKGRLKSYLWAFALQPALEWVLTQGPVVLGTDWYNTMREPDSEGIVKLTPNARIEGGHCYLWRGVDTRRGLARCENSWGEEWGDNGAFWIPLRDLERLISQEGEVATAVEQKLQPKVVVPGPVTAAA